MPIFGIPHETAVEIWGWIETGFFMATTAGLCMIFAYELRWRLCGIALSISMWLAWVVAYDIADQFRNINQ